LRLFFSHFLNFSSSCYLSSTFNFSHFFAMSFAKFATFVALVAAAAPALAHIEMVDPAPLRSPKNPNAGASTDYTYTDPLKGDGSNFPCKGYAGDGGPAVATLNAGSSYPVKLAGSAVHGGGSCQFSLSYDGGKTWGVIHQIIGGCPTENASYDVPVPAGMPSATGALFAWSWFNKIGNREMYMNCAVVDVLGGSGSMELPRMFEANNGNGCVTPETYDVDFASPQVSCANPITPDQKVTLGSGAPASPPASTSTPPTTSAPADPPASSEPAGSDPCPPEDEPTNTPPTGTTPPPTTGGANAWDAAKVYVSGDSACYNGQMYSAKWWTQGETPGAGDVWGTGSGAC
jgi:hypothetical protein